jgi:putative endonuclease
VDKLARLRRLASAWCRDHELRMPLRRVDVIAVLDDGTGCHRCRVFNT